MTETNQARTLQQPSVLLVCDAAPENPHVSVVITTKNRHHLLPRAVASVLEQSYTNLSVTIVDDGSDVPVRYNGSDPRVRVIRNEVSLGLSAARNVGFAATRGEYLAMLDDDDFYFPDKIEKQLAFLRQNPEVDLVFSRVAVQDASGARHYYLGNDHVHSPAINLRAFNLIHPASCLMHRRVWQEIRFEETVKKYEDTLFFNLVCDRFRTAFLPMDAAVWMQDGRADQLTRVHYLRNFKNFRIVCEKLQGVLAADPEVQSLYYSRLAYQAVRCFRFGAALGCLPKIKKIPTPKSHHAPSVRTA